MTADSRTQRDLQADREWVTEYVAKRFPNHVAQLLELIAILGRVRRGGGATDQEIEMSREATCVPDKTGEFAAEILGELAASQTGARRAIESLLSSGNAKLRERGLIALSATPNERFAERLLIDALQDASQKIRRMAADKMMTIGHKAFVPALSAAILRETNGATASEFRRARDLITLGSHSWVDSKGGKWLTRRQADGAVETRRIT
jgi:hypothetical protein